MTSETTPSSPDTTQKQSPLTIPVAIIVAGVLIAGAVLFTRSPAGEAPVTDANNNQKPATTVNAIKPVGASDHILGNPKAQVFIVEYSDLECPFCKRFHEVLKQIMNDYGKDGRVAWVYRQFPIPSLHPKAPTEAHASECVAELGGNTKFWQYIDKIFEVTPSNNQLDLALLPKFAVELGINEQAFNDCQESGRHNARIEADTKDGVDAGATGTPYSVVIAANGKKFPINGALQYASVKQVIETALKEK